jgi:hypothetical protein
MNSLLSVSLSVGRWMLRVEHSAQTSCQLPGVTLQ